MQTVIRLRDRTGQRESERGCCERRVVISDGGFSWRFAEMFSQTKQQTSQLWMWRMEYLHHEQRPLYFGEWF